MFAVDRCNGLLVRASHVLGLCLVGCWLSWSSGCAKPHSALGTAADSTAELTAARKGFQTKLVRTALPKSPVPEAPSHLFRTVYYDAQPGKLAAYVTPDPNDGDKHAAIVWITGGDCNTIGDVWEQAPPENDQTAAAFRDADLVMMFPSLRGGNDNPGVKESFLGEVDDVLAAADYLAQLSYVDPKRIYLGGHSTGGTLVLLVAECSDRFRAVFSFGPVDDVSGYSDEYVTFHRSRAREIELRSPIHWLQAIKSPVFVFEGASGMSNVRALRSLQAECKNPLVQFHPVPRTDHFSVLAPTNALIAKKVVADTGPTCNIQFSDAELATLTND